MHFSIRFLNVHLIKMIGSCSDRKDRNVFTQTVFRRDDEVELKTLTTG